MKVKAVFLNFILVVMTASVAWGETSKQGTIIVEPDKHVVIFNVFSRERGKLIDGLMDASMKKRSVKIDDIKSVNFDGTGTSIITVVNKTQALAVIAGTARSGEGRWTIELKTGELLTLDPSKFRFKGIKVETDEGGSVFYGDDTGDITPPPVLPAPIPKKTFVDFIRLTVC